MIIIGGFGAYKVKQMKLTTGASFSLDTGPNWNMWLQKYLNKISMIGDLILTWKSAAEGVLLEGNNEDLFKEVQTIIAVPRYSDQNYTED